MSDGEYYEDVNYLKTKIDRIAEGIIKRNSSKAERINTIRSHLHYVLPVTHNTGTWIPEVLKQWACRDHNCGYDQLILHDAVLPNPVVVDRLDARYDWLPSGGSTFGDRTLPLIYSEDGCALNKSVNGSVAMVTQYGCSYFKKVYNMEKSGALAVVVFAKMADALPDMNCEGEECLTPLSIPATTIQQTFPISSYEGTKIQYQNTPSDNYFLGISQGGLLQETGWFLYPSFSFLAWQAQWFNYKYQLEQKLAQEAKEITIFNSSLMQGSHGVVVNVSLPSLSELMKYSSVELDMALSCPGSRDTSCAKWDHTIQLFVCCEGAPALCGAELGRWISPFRRRIGRWLTNITALIPLLQGNSCQFQMRTVPWAMPWVPSLNIRLSSPKSNSGGAFSAVMIYNGSVTFDHKYNTKFKPYKFVVPAKFKKVFVVSVITGHGSDENGCGEFCITSHHININNKLNNITFSNAGSPLGCASRVSEGVEPNEHGTWLYGRNGWCDGQEVEPWTVDITAQIYGSGKLNTLTYFGWFNGTDPNPKHNPGIISMYTYLVFYT